MNDKKPIIADRKNMILLLEGVPMQESSERVRNFLKSKSEPINATEMEKLIDSLKGRDLDRVIRLMNPGAKSPSNNLSETWEIAYKHNSEAFHKFELACQHDLWECRFSGLFHSSDCETPQEAILKALLLDKLSITWDSETGGYNFTL